MKHKFVVTIETDGMESEKDMRNIARDLSRFVQPIVVPYVRETEFALVEWIDHRSHDVLVVPKEITKRVLLEDRCPILTCLAAPGDRCEHYDPSPAVKKGFRRKRK